MVKAQSKSQNAVDLYDPTGEKGIQKSPQAFLDCKYKNKISAEYSQIERVGYSKSSNYLCYTLSLTSWKPALVSSVRICSI